MIIVMLVTFLILSCLPLLQAVTNDKISTPVCPESFSCPNLAPFKYPFYNNATDERCRLIKVNCTLKGGEIQLGRQSYEIVEKEDSGPSVVIHNRTFAELVKIESCEALMNNFTSPNPLLYSVSITPFIALFKCRNNLSYTDFYFDQPDYKSYNKCKDYNFYYNYIISNAKISSDLPHTCQEIKLPVKVKTSNNYNEVDETNIFSLLSSSFSISFEPPLICEECKRKGNPCYANNGKCTETKKEAARNLPRGKLLLALGVGVVIILISIILCLKWKFGWRKKAEYNANVETFLKNQAFMAPKRYSYSQIKKMTNTFKVKLGQGGFGSVYRGELSNGNLVAVKVLSQLKGDGKDFVNEVASVGRTCHVNIVSLVGFCLQDRQRALIYEFMPNGSLEKFIYGRESSSNSQLGWEKLHQIAIGIARGLEYLHSGCKTRILHFDIKPHNILLDQDFCPKISDFGLAKLFPEKRSMISVSHMRGTPGYIAPELFSRNFGQVSNKSDVYSYGMMILEMFSGQKNIEVDQVDHTSEIYFPNWIYKKIELNEEQLGVQGILSNEENNMVRKMIIVGLWCIQTNPLNRPTITRVLEMLEGEVELLEIPPKPYTFSPSRPVSYRSSTSSFPATD